MDFADHIILHHTTKTAAGCGSHKKKKKAKKSYKQKYGTKEANVPTSIQGRPGVSMSLLDRLKSTVSRNKGKSLLAGMGLAAAPSIANNIHLGNLKEEAQEGNKLKRLMNEIVNGHKIDQGEERQRAVGAASAGAIGTGVGLYQQAITNKIHPILQRLSEKGIGKAPSPNPPGLARLKPAALWGSLLAAGTYGINSLTDTDRKSRLKDIWNS